MMFPPALTSPNLLIASPTVHSADWNGVLCYGSWVGVEEWMLLFPHITSFVMMVLSSCFPSLDLSELAKAAKKKLQAVSLPAGGFKLCGME